MSFKPQEYRRRLTWPEWLLVGLLAVMVVIDIALLFVSTAQTHLVRSSLTVFAFLAVTLGFGLGVVQTPTYAVGVFLSLPFVVVYSYTGLLLPWTQFSFYVGQVLIESLLSIPVVGEPLAVFLFGGVTLSAKTLQIAFHYHYIIVGIVFLGLLYPMGRAVWIRRANVDTS